MSPYEKRASREDLIAHALERAATLRTYPLDAPAVLGKNITPEELADAFDWWAEKLARL
jgi:hypothetical protein